MIIDLGWNKIKTIISSIDKKSIEVGFIDNSKNIATIAFFNEFGHKARDGSQVPERPFMRNAIKKYKESFFKESADRIKSIMRFSLSVDSYLNQSGKFWQDKFKYSIAEFSDPANKPSTVKRKGFNDPLIHTGLMLATVKYKIK
jgi:hypothetical protein